MVPGMNVAQVDAHSWAVSARGFNDLFANKLLVMMDGRSVYGSLFSGTFWDVQDTVLEDVERVEVIRGPGASLWGANAVNGVINVITKSAANSQGLMVTGSAGTEERAAGALRYGGKLGESLYYRVYAKHAVHDESAVLGTGFPEALIRLNTGGGSGSVGSASSPPRTPNDGWSQARAGFRFDWNPPRDDRLTVQGDVYDGREHQLYQRLTPGSFGSFYERDVDTVSGGNVLARWTHVFSNTAEWALQTYYDRSVRELAVLGEKRQTWDVDFQNQFARR
jgi:iron complex outermembrane receptor protein